MNEYTYTIPTDPITGQPSTSLIIRSDGWQIPTDPSNSMYQAYLATLAANSSTPQG